SSSPSCCEMVICISFDGRLVSLKMACRVRRWRSVNTSRGFFGCCGCWEWCPGTEDCFELIDDDPDEGDWIDPIPPPQLCCSSLRLHAAKKSEDKKYEYGLIGKNRLA